MAERIESANADEVLDREVSLPDNIEFLDWIANHRLQDLKRLGIGRVLHKVIDLSMDDTELVYGSTRDEQDPAIYNAFTVFVHEFRGARDSHKWEENLLYFLYEAGFLDTEVADAIAGMIEPDQVAERTREALVLPQIGDIPKAEKEKIITAFNAAAERLGKQTIF